MSQGAKSRSLENAPRIRIASAADVEPLAGLINAAFVVERPFIEGERIDPAGVREYMQKGNFLVAEDAAELAGCVYVELRGERGYLGLLGVAPARQGMGLGRKLMEAAEVYFQAAGCLFRTRSKNICKDAKYFIFCYFINSRYCWILLFFSTYE